MDVILDTNALSAWLDGDSLLLPVLTEVDTLFYLRSFWENIVLALQPPTIGNVMKPCWIKF